MGQYFRWCCSCDGKKWARPSLICDGLPMKTVMTRENWLAYLDQYFYIALRCNGCITAEGRRLRLSRVTIHIGLFISFFIHFFTFHVYGCFAYVPWVCLAPCVFSAGRCRETVSGPVGLVTVTCYRWLLVTTYVLEIEPDSYWRVVSAKPLSCVSSSENL